MKIKIAYEDTRFSVPEEFTEEAGQCFGVEVERGSNIPLTLSIDAYRSGVCDEDGETILGCLKNRTYCSARALEVKRKLDCDRLLAVTRKLPRPPERSEEKKVVPGFANSEEGIGFVWQWASTISVLHELGHLVGLEDCPNQPCLMNKEVRSEELCDECSEKLS